MKANLNKFWGSAKLNENLCCVKKSHFGVCWDIVILSYGEKMFFLCRKVLSLDWCIVKSTELSLWFSGAVPICPRLRSRETLHIVLRAHVSSYILQLTVCFVLLLCRRWFLETWRQTLPTLYQWGLTLPKVMVLAANLLLSVPPCHVSAPTTDSRAIKLKHH